MCLQNFDVLCSHLAQQHAQATTELARVSHSRPGFQVGAASAGRDARGGGQTSPQALRKAASTAVQGLRSTFFRHGSFLELVCLWAIEENFSKHCDLWRLS